MGSRFVFETQTLIASPTVLVFLSISFYVSRVLTLDVLRCTMSWKESLLY